MNATPMTHPFFSVNPSKAVLATDASSGVSKDTWAIFTLAPSAFGVGDHVTCVAWKPWYLADTKVNDGAGVNYHSNTYCWKRTAKTSSETSCGRLVHKSRVEGC